MSQSSISDSCSSSSGRNNLSSSLVALISGAGAGIACSILCAPLDVAKVRMQVQGSLHMHKYSTASQTLKLIFKEEGIRGCFRGLGPTLVTVPLFWSIYWTTYDALKESLSRFVYLENSKHLQHVSSAIIAGALGDLITSPFWVVRTRIQTYVMHNVNIGLRISTLSMFKQIYASEGIGAFYKGLGASFLGLSHVAIQFPIYEYLKVEAQQYRQATNSVGSVSSSSVLDLTAASVTAKLIASSISYPHEVLRARLQDGRKRSRGLLKELVSIVNEEGILSLWSGYRVNLLRIFPATVGTFVAYEVISENIKKGNTIFL